MVTVINVASESGIIQTEDEVGSIIKSDKLASPPLHNGKFDVDPAKSLIIGVFSPKKGQKCAKTKHFEILNKKKHQL